MTTIAYRDGVLAGDTRVTQGDMVCPERSRKVRKLRNGCLFAHAGDAEEGTMLLRCLQKRQPLPKTKNSSTIVVMPDGAVLYSEGATWEEVKAPFVAIGSGADFAYGAMAMGASAVEAVRIACKYDKNSARPIQVVKLAPPKA